MHPAAAACRPSIKPPDAGFGSHHGGVWLRNMDKTVLFLTACSPTNLHRGEPLPQEILDHRPDTILAADCVYFEPAFPLLLQTLQDLLALCPTATVYFCFKKRRRADMQFLKAAKKAFKVVETEDEDRPTFSREGLFLYTFSCKE